jgi:hypothetical protein
MVWRAGTAAQNWGEAPAPQAKCATPLGLSLSKGLGRSFVLELTALFIGRWAVAKALPCFLLGR